MPVLVISGVGIVGGLLWWLSSRAGASPPDGDGNPPVFVLGKPTVVARPNPDPYIPTTIPEVTATITNNGSVAATHTIGIYTDYYAQNSNEILYNDRFCYSEVVTLQPGASYTMHWYDPMTGNQLYHNYADFFLMDELGNRSQMTRLQA